MATQIKSIEMAESANLTAVAQPNIVLMNGCMKEVEQIRIEDPNSVDQAIEGLRSLSKEERNKSVKWIVAIVVLATVAIFSPFLIFTAPVSVMLGCMISSLLGFTFSMVGFGSHDAICRMTDEKIKKLIVCQKDLQKEDFRSFVKSFGESMSVDELLQAHSLYREQKTLEQNISALRQRN